jgi:hypothetical protein
MLTIYTTLAGAAHIMAILTDCRTHLEKEESGRVRASNNFNEGKLKSIVIFLFCFFRGKARFWIFAK